MDFHAMKRKRLQSLCKEHGIPANLMNIEMADRLALLLKGDVKPNEAVCENLDENEREFDSEVEKKNVKKVKFSPENQTFYFVGTDNDSDSDRDYNPKKKQGGKRKSMVVKQVSENKQARVVEKSRDFELAVEIFDSPGRVTRSKAQKMVRGDAETIFLPLPRKRKGRTGVKKVDVCEKSRPEVEISEKVDGNAERAKLSGVLIQRQLRSRVVVCGDGGNSLALSKNVTRSSKKTKEHKGSDGVLLPSKTYKNNVPAGKGVKPQKVQKEYKGNVTKVEDSSDWSEKPGKIDLGCRITRSRTQVEGKSSGVESKPGILKGKGEVEEVLQLEETFKGLDRKQLRRKSAAHLKGSLEGENLAGEAAEPVKTIRRSKRNLARDSVCGQLAETKVVGRRKKPKTDFLGKASVHQECKEVPQLEEPSEGPSMNTSRLKFSVVPKGKELARGGTRKQPRNPDLERASKVDQSVQTVEGSVVRLPNGPLRRSRRKTTLFSSAAPDDNELKVREAAATVKQSTESVTEQSVETIEESVVLLPSSPLRRSRRKTTLFSSPAPDDREFRIHEASGTVKQSTESVAEKGSNVTKSPRRSSRNVCKKIVTEATDGMGEISNGVKRDGIVKQIEEPTLEKESSYNVNESLNKRPQRRSPRNASKSDLVAPSGLTGIAAGKNKKSESRIPIIAEDLFAKVNSPLEENPNLDVGLDVPEAAENENDIDSCSYQEVVEKSSKRKGSSKKSESLNRGDTVGDADDHSCPSVNRGDTGHDNTVEHNPVECPDKLSNVASSRSICLGDGQSSTYQPDCGGECSNLLDLEEKLETDELDDQLADGGKASVHEDRNLVQLDASGIDKPVLVAPVILDHLTELVENKESCRNTEKSAKVVEGLGALSSDTKEIVQVDKSCPSFNRDEGDTGHDNTVAQNPVECQDKLSNVVSSRFTCLGDGHTPTYQPDCVGESSSLLRSKEGLETDDSLAVNTPNQRSDVVDDQLDHDSKASVPEDQNSVQLDASGTNQPVLVEPVREDCLTELVENKESYRSSDKSSEVVEEISTLFPCDSEKMVQADVVDDQLEHNSKASVLEDQNSVQLDASGSNQAVLVEPVHEDRLTELVENKESDRSSDKSSEVVEEISALCPCDREKMVQVDVGSIEIAETGVETVGDIHKGRIVPHDTAEKQDNRAMELHDKSGIFNPWEMSTIFGYAEHDMAGKSDEPVKGYSKNKYSENAMDDADNTKIFERCEQQFSEQQLGGYEYDAELAGPILGDNNEQDDAYALIQEYINCEKVRDEHFEVKNPNVCTHKPMFTEACRISDSDYAGIGDIAAENTTISGVEDKCRNSGVPEDRARAMTGDRMEMQQSENRDTLLPFGSVDPKMGFPEQMVEFCKINVPAQGASINVANERSKEVAETLLQFDELNFEGLGNYKEFSSEHGKCASASGDSISRDDETAERLENVRKMDEESSSKDVSFDARRECNLGAISAVISNNISDQLAEKECPASSDNSLDDTVLVYGHRNNNVALDKVGTRSMETITGIENVDEGTKFVEETQIRLNGGNPSDERNSSDANSFSGISSSSAYLGPSDLTLPVHNISLSGSGPVRLPMQECDKFGTAERVSGMKVDEGKDGLCNELGGDPEERDLPAQEGNEFGVPERVSGMKVDEGLNAGINSLGEENCTPTSQEQVDLHNLDGVEIFSGHSKESPGFDAVSLVKLDLDVDCSADTPVTASSHGTKALELNAVSPEMSKVNSMSEDSENVKESAVVIPQVAAGQLTGHEYTLEEVVEPKSIQEMGTDFHVGSPVTNFSSCGNDKRDGFQSLDAGLTKANMRNEVSEDVKEGKENALGVAQVFAGQHGDHGQRMAEECLKSSHPSVSDENTCVNKGPKEIGIRPINHELVDCVDTDECGDVEYSNVCTRTGNLIDDAEMSGRNSGAFDGAEAKGVPNYLKQGRNPDEDAEVLVESDIVSELNVTVDQCPSSANSVWRKEIFESTGKECREADLDTSISASDARWEHKKDSLIPRTPTSLVNTIDMKENFTSTKSNQVSGSEKTLQSRGALEDLQKK